MATRMALAENTTFRVIDWDNNKVIKTFDNPNQAKKYCRDLGYFEDIFNRKCPIAFVQADYIDPYDVKLIACCFYNPRF